MRRNGFSVWGVPVMFFDGDGGPPAPPAPPADYTVTMTKAELDTLIKGRIDSAVAAATKKAPSPEALAELETLRNEKRQREQDELAKKGQYEAALKSQEDSIRKEYEPKLTAAEQRAKDVQTKLEDKVVGLAVSDAAGKLNAVNPEQVRRLLASDVRMNEQFEAIVVDAAGNQRFVAGKAMTPEQLVKEFLDANPHLVRSTAGAGGGAGGGRSVTSGDGSAIAAAEAKVKALAEEATRSGTPRALVAHEQAVKELNKLKAGAAA